MFCTWHSNQRHSPEVLNTFQRSLTLAVSRERAQLLKEWMHQDLLIVGNLFLVRRITNQAAEILKTIFHRRYKLRRIIVVKSNRVVQHWVSI